MVEQKVLGDTATVAQIGAQLLEEHVQLERIRCESQPTERVPRPAELPVPRQVRLVTARPVQRFGDPDRV